MVVGGIKIWWEAGGGEGGRMLGGNFEGRGEGMSKFSGLSPQYGKPWVGGLITS